MKRIFISTNYDKLDLVIGDKRDTIGINLINDADVLVFKDGIFHKCQANQIEGVSLFIIKDTSLLLNDDRSPIVKINNELGDYLMRHNTCNHANYFNLSNIHSNGMHEEGDPYYGFVFNSIILNGEISANEKAAMIIEFLFPTAETILGNKLELLHHLLVPPVDFTEANKQWEKLKKAVKTANDSGVKVTLSSDEKALDVFETESTGKTDAFDPQYLDSLRTLRDKLLAS